MSDPVVIDSSAGVKWFRDEGGSEAMFERLREHGRGALTLCVATVFLYEFASVAKRELGVPDGREAYNRLLDWRLGIFEFDAALARETWDTCERLDCSFYDAVAPALATLLGAPLYSADHRAHARYENSVLLG